VNQKSSGSASALSVQVVIIALLAWGIFALLFFLLFSVPLPGQERAGWYSITTYVLEDAAFLAAALLCFRNYGSPQIVSGRSVWLLIGSGMLSFFIGNLILGQWEIGWGKEPDVSPADVFFLLMYLLVGIGMIMAVTSRKLNLSLLQILTVFGIGIAGAVFAWFIYNGAGEEAALWFEAPAIAQTSPIAEPAPLAPIVEPAPVVAPAPPAPPAPIVEPAPPAPVVEPAPITAPAPVTAPSLVAPSPDPALATPAADVPSWALALEELFAPLGDSLAIAYVAGDIVLLMSATMLLLAFWGGRFSLSWRFIAAAAICFYVADMWFLYATRFVSDYQTGGLLEVFWIFSACLFGIGAALEYDLSSRSRRASRRRS